MIFQDLALIAHIALGICALLLALAAMRSPKMRGAHTIIGNVYHWTFCAMAISACALAVMDWHRLWWFVPIAVFSYAFALTGFLAAKFKPRNWLRIHLVGQGGSFIAMCTAILVVNFASYTWLAWMIPTLIGAPVLVWYGREIRKGRRPIRSGHLNT